MLVLPSNQPTACGDNDYHDDYYYTYYDDYYDDCYDDGNDDGGGNKNPTLSISNLPRPAAM